MQGMDLWRLCDHVSVFQAIMLILGDDPGTRDSWEIENRKSSHDGYGAVKTALVNAIKTKIIMTNVVLQEQRDVNGDSCGEIPDSVDIDRTIVSFAEVRDFLRNKGFTSGFFFPAVVEPDEFLDVNHDCYAPKLAAAVNAWKAVSGDGLLLKGKTPKQAVLKWLRENAPQYGLTDEDGKPVEQAIEEIAKVANWKPEGGAAKTPTLVVDNPPTPKKNKKSKLLTEDDDDQAVPF